MDLMKLKPVPVYKDMGTTVSLCDECHIWDGDMTDTYKLRVVIKSGTMQKQNLHRMFFDALWQNVDWETMIDSQKSNFIEIVHRYCMVNDDVIAYLYQHNKESEGFYDARYIGYAGFYLGLDKEDKEAKDEQDKQP